MGYGVQIYGGIYVFLENELSQKTINKMNRWIRKKSEDFFGWDVEFSNVETITITLEKNARDDLDNYLGTLVDFLKKFSQYLDVSQSLPWNSDHLESGVIHISTNKKKISMVTISDDGEMSIDCIKWD